MFESLEIRSPCSNRPARGAARRQACLSNQRSLTRSVKNLACNESSLLTSETTGKNLVKHFGRRNRLPHTLPFPRGKLIRVLIDQVCKLEHNRRSLTWRPCRPFPLESCSCRGDSLFYICLIRDLKIVCHEGLVVRVVDCQGFSRLSVHVL